MGKNIQTLISSFEEIKHIEDDFEFWSARDLQKLLWYSKWENFSNSIEKAKISCKEAWNKIDDQFPEVRKPITSGKWAIQEVKDYNLSRYACYLIAQNWDPKKQEIAKQSFLENLHATGQHFLCPKCITLKKFRQKTGNKKQDGEQVIHKNRYSTSNVNSANNYQKNSSSGKSYAQQPKANPSSGKFHTQQTPPQTSTESKWFRNFCDKYFLGRFLIKIYSWDLSFTTWLSNKPLVIKLFFYILLLCIFLVLIVLFLIELLVNFLIKLVKGIFISLVWFFKLLCWTFFRRMLWLMN